MKEINRKVAIIIVNYNGKEDTLECLQSIYKMRHDIEYNVFVVDNASMTNELAVIKSVYPQIVDIQSEVNLGFAGGNNLAIRLACETGHTDILLLNNDTVVSDDLLVHLMKENDMNSILAPKILYYSDPDIIWYGGGIINRKTGNSIHVNKDKHDGGGIENTMKCSFVSGCCMLIPCEVLEKVGVLNDTYFMYCEDTEYCLRAMKHDVEMRYVSQAVLWHKVSRSTGGDESDFCVYYMTRNRLRYIKEHRDYFAFYAYAFSIGSRLLRAVEYLVAGKKSWFSFIRGIRDVELEEPPFLYR